MGRFSAYIKQTEPQSEVKKPVLGPHDLIEDVTVDKPAAVKPAAIQPIAPKPAAPLAKAKRDPLMEMKVKLHNRLIDEFDLTSLEGADGTPQTSKIFNIVKTLAKEEKLKLNNEALVALSNGIVDEMRGLGPLETLLADESVSDILINGHEQVYVERGGELELSDIHFASEPHLLRIINRIVAQVGRRVDESLPLCDARLLDGSRVNVAIAPIAVDGPLVSIR